MEGAVEEMEEWREANWAVEREEEARVGEVMEEEMGEWREVNWAVEREEELRGGTREAGMVAETGSSIVADRHIRKHWNIGNGEFDYLECIGSTHLGVECTTSNRHPRTRTVWWSSRRILSHTPFAFVYLQSWHNRLWACVCQYS